MMLVGKCLAASHHLLPNRTKCCRQRCCALVSAAGHQQEHVTQVAARTGVLNKGDEGGIASPIDGLLGHLDGKDAYTGELLTPPEAPVSVVSPQALLNGQLKRCSSWEELSDQLHTNWGCLDFVNISTSWVRLASLYGRAHALRAKGLRSARPPSHEPAFHQFLAKLISVTIQQLRWFGMQALSNVMWAMSNDDWQLEQHEPAVKRLVREWSWVTVNHIEDLRAPDVSMISTAIGRLDHIWSPGFVVAFYRAVLRRTDIVMQADVTTLNNLLFGISRAQRRGLIHLAPLTRVFLASCVGNLLERVSRGEAQSLRMEPWRAAQLLSNCYKLRVKLNCKTFSLLMPIVAQTYTHRPSPLDCWEMRHVVALVAAHTNMPPTVRPDVTPLREYVEGRAAESPTSSLTMLATAFAKMQQPVSQSFWAHVFSRYGCAPAPAGSTAVQAQGRGRYPLQPPPPPQQQQQLGVVDSRQQEDVETPRRRFRPVDRLEGEQQQQEELPRPRAKQRPGLDRRRSPQVPAPLELLPPQDPSMQPQPLLRPVASLSGGSSPCLPVSVGQGSTPCQEGQQQERLGLGRREQGPFLESPVSPAVGESQQQQEPHSEQQHAMDPGRGVQGQRRSAQGELPLPREPPEPMRQQQQLLESPQEGPQSQFAEPQLPQEQPTASQEQQQRPFRKQQQLPQGQQLPAQEQKQERLGPRPHALHAMRVKPHGLQERSPHEQPQAGYQPSGLQHVHPVSRSQQPPPYGHMRQQRQMQPQAHTSRYPDQLEGEDAPSYADELRPKTLHLVCWQAAKAGILPPRSFLRFYIAAVPRWLVQEASDVECVQAVHTLKLLKWVPGKRMREALCCALERRAKSSRFALRKAAQWVRDLQ